MGLRYGFEDTCVCLCFISLSLSLSLSISLQVIKLYAWEIPFKNIINTIRNKELTILRKAAYLMSFMMFSWSCSPFLVSSKRLKNFLAIECAVLSDPTGCFGDLCYLRLGQRRQYRSAADC